MTSRHAAALVVLASLASACRPTVATPAAAPLDPTPPAAALDPGARAAVVATYADIAYAVYRDAHDAARALQTAVAALVDAPSDATLAAARTAWLAAREVYGQTEVYRFYDGPIDHAETGVEGLVNAWPLDEAYLDYVDGDPAAGIVNAVEAHPDLSAHLLVDLNELGGEKNIATGFHAIEFLLWGQDRSADGPGARPAADFVDGQGVNAARRRQLLALEADLLTQHLRQVVAAWDLDEVAGYRRRFVADEGALGKMFTGLVQLSGHELAGERLGVALETRDQEDEHSCFSDNTHRDFVAGAQGLANVWHGRYGAIDGPGLDTLVAAVDPAQADAVTAAVAAAQAAAAAVPPPFDQAVAAADGTPERTAVEAMRAAFEALASELAGAAAAVEAAAGGGGA